MSTGVGALGGLPGRRRQAEPLRLTRCACNDMFFLGIVVCALSGIYKRLTSPATGLPRSSGVAGDDIGDDIVQGTPEFEEIFVFASGTAIFSGSQGGSIWSFPKTFRLDRSTLGQPIGTLRRQYISWVAHEVWPMKQRVPDTCALVACTVAMEAMHRFKHGNDRKFCWTAAEPEHLLGVCKRNKIWSQGNGASIEQVLKKIWELSGVPVVTDDTAVNSDSARLPLTSWKVHKLGDDLCRVVELLHRGPCVGTLWMCPWYTLFDASRDNGYWVYRGCGRSETARKECERLYGKKLRFHAVVCFGYRLCSDQMHVLVMDNHEDTGPWRWVHVEELHVLYTLDLGDAELENDFLLKDPRSQYVRPGRPGGVPN